MQPLRFGIVGPGYIAGVIADAIAGSGSSALTVVSSRTLANVETQRYLDAVFETLG